MMNRTSSLIATLILTTLIVSCSENSPDPTEPSGETTLTESIDREFLKQIKGMGDIFAKNAIWNGYPYGTYGQYVVHVTGTTPDRGYLINPGSTVSGATQLGNNEDQGLNVYRYDGQTQEAYDVLFGSNGNQSYDFNFMIDGKGYYVQIYKDESVLQNGIPVAEEVSLSTHENFHDFQNSWTEVPNATQDIPNFPVTKELLELQILAAEIFQGIPNTPTDQAALRNLLKQYVAIRTKEIELDPSPGKLVRNMELAQEQGEGSAKYIEVMANRQYFSNMANVSLMDYSLLDLTSTTKFEVQDNVSFNILYNTGGSAIYILDALGANIEEMQNGKTPYDIAVAFLNMSQSEIDAALADAKTIANWDQIQKRAEEWAGLQ